MLHKYGGFCDFGLQDVKKRKKEKEVISRIVILISVVCAEMVTDGPRSLRLTVPVVLSVGAVDVRVQPRCAVESWGVGGYDTHII